MVLGLIATLALAQELLYPLPPCRVYDSRDTDGPLAFATERAIAVRGRCDIPAAATTVQANVTVIPKDGKPMGYITVWPTGSTMPVVSTLNALDGGLRSNGSVFPLGKGGKLSLFANGETDVIVDVSGYFRPLEIRAGAGIDLIRMDWGWQIAANTGDVQSVAAAKAGTANLCLSVAGPAYSCWMQPAIVGKLTSDMVIRWKPQFAASGAITLDVDGNGPLPVQALDGGPAVIVGGRLYDLWLDAAVWRVR